MKKVVAFLLAFLIFVTPMTTFVNASVVIGDNDETILNENATILGRKLALLESFSDLALSGVTEFTISNTNDVDSYLDYLWGEVNDAIESLSNGTGFTEISNDLKSKYFTNLVQYQDYINNRGDYLAHLLPSGNPTTNLLSTYFANNIFGKHSTLQSNLSLNTFKALREYNNSPDIDIPVDFSFINNINQIYIKDYYGTSIEMHNFSEFANNRTGSPFYPMDYSSCSFTGEFVGNNINLHSGLGIVDHYSTIITYNTPLITINVDSTDPNNVLVNYSSFGHSGFGHDGYNTHSFYCADDNGVIRGYYITPGSDSVLYYTQTSFSGLSTAINYIYSHYCNINLYVNGDCWAYCGIDNNSPKLDIDGLLKIYGNNNPVQYELQPQTQLDYDQLYQVIYNAIRDNLPISQDDINYYDSHDTIYSPTIINNYGEDEGDESDLIDTILDYAVIPKFDTAIAQPMRQALTNGVVIMNTSITDVIPNEILLILGACFFLLLFAVVINRMIK